MAVPRRLLCVAAVGLWVSFAAVAPSCGGRATPPGAQSTAAGPARNTDPWAAPAPAHRSATAPRGGNPARSAAAAPGTRNEPVPSDAPVHRRSALAPGGPSTLSALASQLLAAHNAQRARHCAPPLRWDADLAAVATRWAERLGAAGCALAHSQSAWGENLAMMGGGTMAPAEVVQMWYDEVRAYDFARGAFGMDTGHFTQVVWRGTERLGCARATCRQGEVWVCNYAPAGNVMGAFSHNVLPEGCAR